MKKTGLVVFGLSNYALFGLTVVYLIGFLAKIGVPKDVNDGAMLAWPLAVLLNLGLIALFALQHTVMARQSFKTAVAKIIPEAGERSLYVLASSVVLIVVMAFWAPVPGVVWSASADWLRGLLWAGFLLGWGLVLLSTFLIDHFGLFGLRQVWDEWRGEKSPDIPFTTPSLYKWVRHPMMTGFLIALWVTPDMSLSHLLFAAGFSVYIWGGTKHEERGLIALFGDQYVEYARRTPRFFPGPKG